MADEQAPGQELTQADIENMGPPQRARAAVAMKISGADNRVIADFLGYANANAVQAAVESVLASTVDETHAVPHLRALYVERLERLFRSVYEKAAGKDANKADDHLAYVRTALSIVDRQAALTGANAPQRLEVSTPDDNALRDWVIRMAKQVGPEGVAQEADIMDAEIVEGALDDENVEGRLTDDD